MLKPDLSTFKTFLLLLGRRHNTTSPWPWSHCLNNMLVRNLPWSLILHIGMKGNEWKRGQKPSDASSCAAFGFKGKAWDVVTGNNSWWRHTKHRTRPPHCPEAIRKAEKGEEKQRWVELWWGREGKTESRRVHRGRCVHTSGWQARSELRGAFPCLG